MSSDRPSARRLLVALAALLPLGLHAACATNGEAIPSEVYDASALDAGGSIGEPVPPAQRDAGRDGPDDATASDAADASPGSGPVEINELFVDNAVLGDGAEFVELRGAPGMRVDDLKLRLVTATGVVKYEVAVGPAGSVFHANGLWVVGGAQTYKLNVTPSTIDVVVGLASWGLDNAGGAVQVVRGSTLLDVVGYRRDPDGGALPPAASPPAATVEGRPATVPDPPAGQAPQRSLGRRAAALDTNENATDFCAMQASPGAANSCL